MQQQQRPGFAPLSPLPLALVAVAVPIFCSAFALLIALLVMQGVGLGVLDDLVNRLAEPEGRDAVLDTGAEMYGTLFDMLMLAFVVSLARRREPLHWPPLSFAWQDWAKDRGFLRYVGFLLAWELIVFALVAPGFPEIADVERLPIGTPALLLSLLGRVVLESLAEEIFYRGFVYSHLRAHAGFATTIVTTSCLFALLHSSANMALPVLTLPTGFILGIARERYASVRPAIYLHMIWSLAVWGEGYFAIVPS